MKYMVVYIDILLFENLIVNCFLLEITAKTVKKNVKWIPMMTAGLLGSIYVLVLFYPEASFVNSLPVKCIIAFIMIIITFGIRDKRFLLKTGTVFIMYSMLLAGICIFMQYSEGVDINGSIIMNFTFKKLFIAIMLVFIAVNRLVIFVKERKQISELIYKIDIIFNSSMRSVNGFLDTGNELREPVTNMPVILVNKNIYESFCAQNSEKYYIPYRIFNGNTGNLEAFKPDYINVYIGKKIIKKNAIIALCNENLSPSDEYEALLSRGIFL